MFRSHRHVRWALFFHSLALITCIRAGKVTGEEGDRYLKQVNDNQTFIKKYVGTHCFHALSHLGGYLLRLSMSAPGLHSW